MPSPTIETLGVGYLWFATVFALMALPFLRRMVPRNYFCGYRLRAAMRSPEAWYAINEFAARRSLRYCGVLFCIGIGLLLFSHFVTDFQVGPGFPWQVLVGILPLCYCLLRPLWEASQWAKRHPVA